ncbi:MAG: tetratricopeptide repeat protein [Acidobacteria bacterium]|nr:MAG: tetratricopeptide repeat protein [Acidobacteriota bacterium]
MKTMGEAGSKFRFLPPVLALLLLLPACRQAASPAHADSDLTFYRDVEPIVFDNCAMPCHHPGGAGPFSLLTYQDVRKRARQIAVVTGKRYMPPWLPEPQGPRFAGERRLSEEQIERLRRWAEQGAAEGNRAASKPRSTPSEGWQLGKPDLVLSLSKPYILPPAGTDVFRNFVFPVPITTARHVKAIEILPGKKDVVHHANLLIDRQQSSRQLDAQDQEVGFAGMDVVIESSQFEPDSHFLFWKPGTPPSFEPPGMTWRLDPGTDLVLNAHLQPSGKPETIQPALGIYFSDEAPTLFPMLLQLEHDGALDIPPGEKDFVVSDEYRLPVDVEVLGVYPHAHYLGKVVDGWADLPGGRRQPLIRINQWDLNWQAVYRYEKPVFLPEGSVIRMRFTYDNSTENVRNPNQPPRRVKAGNRSSDEMGHLWVQVLPRRGQADRIVLQEALMRRRLRKYPTEFSSHFNLASVLQTQDHLSEAIKHYQAALSIRPDALALNSLGTAWQQLDRIPDAAECYEKALRLRPDYPDAHYNLGVLLLKAGRTTAAITHLQQVLRARPEDADAHNDLGSALFIEGRVREAAAEFKAALRLNPDHQNARENLELAEGRAK